MGCGLSAHARQPGLRPAKMLHAFLEQLNIANDQDALDMRAMVLLLWRARDKEFFSEVVLNLVAHMAADRESFDGIEFYLPQVVHMLVHLEVDWETDTIEQFCLFVAQQSIHLAIQVSFILVGLMEDYQTESPDGSFNKSADPRLYQRCAVLLEEIELAVVYGTPSSSQASKLFRNKRITKEELVELQVADRRFQAAQIADVAHKFSGFHMDGKLQYKRWKKRSGLHSDAWIARRFVIGYRVLYCLRLSDNFVKRSIMLQDCEVVVPDRSPDPSKPFYFELHEKDRDRKFLLAAASAEERDRWVDVLRRFINAPPPMPSEKLDWSTVDLTSLSPSQIARFGFYRSERSFVRVLTDICEELRFVDTSERKTKLREKLAKLDIPGCVYVPLCKSTDPWRRVLSVVPEESTAFSTRERCPCLICFEVTDDDDSQQDTATFLFKTLGADELSADDDVDDIELSGTDAARNLKRAQLRDAFVQSARNSLSRIDRTSSKDLDRQQSSEGRISRASTLEMPGVWINLAEPAVHEMSASTSSDPVKRRKWKFERLKEEANRIAGVAPGSSDDKTADRPEGANGKTATPGGAGRNGNGTTHEPPLKNRGTYLPALGKFKRAPAATGPNEEEAPEGFMSDEPDKVLDSGEQRFFGKLMAKSNDDLRQECFIMQMIQFLHDIWADRGIGLFVNPYRIISTSQTCGLIEFLEDSTSFDGLKKDNDRCTVGEFFAKKYSDPEELARIRRNFTDSMAGYSLVCYILGIKDRHNGNIMLHLKSGFVTHIDFGFVMGMAPGKDKVKHTNFSMERAAFKLTPELIDAMGGKKSENWKRFNDLIVEGLLEARKHIDTLVTLVEITGYKSKLPCFNQPGGGTARVVRELRQRLMLNLNDSQAEKRMRKLTAKAANSTGTKIYERFQKFSNGLEPCR